MPDYEAMYLKLFNAMSDAISILQQAQQEVEEIYVSAEEPDMITFDRSNIDNHEERDLISYPDSEKR